MQNVIVTGGAGFIGSNLCKTLVSNGFSPITIDDLSTGFRQLVKYGDFIEADCGDYKKMMEVFLQYKPIAIFHIAGSKSVPESIRDPFKYYENNFSKTNNLLKATVDSKIKHFIFSSSAAIFGQINDDIQAVKEDFTPKPINPYGYSKLIVERLLSDYERAYGLNYSSLRYFNVSGADPECELGEMSDHVTNIFPILLKSASGQQSEFKIFGDDYNTEDGTCIRDYIHVNDLVLAHVLAFKKQLENKKSATLNLGNGVGFSVKEVVEVFKQVTGKDFKVTIAPRREGDAACVVANNELSGQYLGWNPKYQNLKDHVSHAWNWYKTLS